MTYSYNLGLAFEQIVDRFAENTALRFVDGSAVSYRELDRLSNRIAHALLTLGVARRDVVGIFQSKTQFGFAAMLAALKLGATYVNLDDQNPALRISAMLDSCRPRLILTDCPLPSALVEACLAVGASPIFIETLEHQAKDGTSKRLPDTRMVVGSDPAYLMFTSGSTGVPKGALIAHSSVMNLIGWSQTQFEIRPNDILTNVNPVYFDNSVFDFYSALFSGATLVPFPRDIVSQPTKLVSLVEELACTLWFSVPSMLIYLITLRQLTAKSWPAMRCLAFGGEGYPTGELRKLFDLFGHRAQLVNVYGPTECTCICSAYPVGRTDLEGKTGLPPLGSIAINFDYLILGEDDREVSCGDAGELCLLGPQVGLGYYNDAERTAASFVRNPLNTNFFERMYRCGDLVRQDSQGKIWFVGRKDNQIKHMGYRIELEEVEAALNSLPDVSESAAVYERVREQHGRIVAFLAGPDVIDEQGLRVALRNRLPDYMVPSKIYVLPVLPKNANGKIDRKGMLSRAAENLSD